MIVRPRLLLLAAILALAAFPGRLLAFQGATRVDLPNFDKRREAAPGERKLTPAREAAAEKLRERVRGLRIGHDEMRGAVRHIASTEGFLTAARARAGPAGDPHRTIKAFLDEHAALFGQGSEILQGARLMKDSVARQNSLRTVVWAQRLDDIAVYEGVLIGHLTGQGELASLSTQFIPQAARAADAGTPNRAALERAPTISALRAILIAADNIGEVLQPGDVQPLVVQPQGNELRQTFKAGQLPGAAQTRHTWLPMNESVLRLCWEVELTRRAGGERHRLIVDAQSGEVYVRQCLTVYAQPASFRVFVGDSPTPFSPGWSFPNSNQPPAVARQLVTFTALDTNASPLGWINAGENETRGNNVDAHTDRNADDAPDLPRPQGSPQRVFDPPLDLAQSPADFSDAATVNLFYWCNWMHDRLYELGFDEAAGNFQKDNLGRGGLGSDAIEADAQDGSGINNANFTSAPDGTAGRIQMFLFGGPEPDRDGDFDTEIILHEYTHGLTTRLVGGGIGISGFQTAGMGEGWSDFYAMALLSRAEDDLDGTYPFAAYASYKIFGLNENYYFGIRRYPYSTDLSKAPLTFKDIDGNQISPHAGVPLSPIFAFSQGTAAEVHNQGEVWCSALWEARANLVRKHGFAIGNPLILRLVTDGLKLAPPNPNFLEARDAILLADQINTGGANFTELWRGFAKRGLGFSARSPDANYTTVIEAYDLPDALSILNPNGLIAGGPPGGPFAPGCQSYGLTNLSTNTIAWTVRGAQPWLSITPVSGTLPPRGQALVNVCVASNAAALPFGNFTDLIVFSNTTSHVTQNRPAQVRVQDFASLPFSDGFESGLLASHWIVSGTGPSRAQVTALNGPHLGNFQLNLDSAGGGVSARNEVTLGLDLGGFTNVVLRFWARSFGDEPDGPPASPFIDGADFDGVAISADGTHWYEVQSFRELTDRFTEFVVDLDEAIAEHGLAYNGRFRIRFNQFDNFQIPFDGIAIDDVSVSGLPSRRLVVQVPRNATEGDGVLANQGLVSLGARVTSDVTVALTSSNASRVSVPASVTIPAGGTSAFFNVTVPDNMQLDGTEAVTISASAVGFYSTGASIAVDDNESTTLKVMLPPHAREGDGMLRKQGRIHLNMRASRDIVVSLSTSPAGKVQVPEAVVIPAGAKDADFDLIILDDLSYGGPNSVTVTAHVDNWIDGHASIMISDNDSRSLSLIMPSSAGEADGVLSNAAVVRLAATLPADVVIALSSSDTTELVVPATVKIPAGQFEARFDLTVVDDSLVDGRRNVMVTARAPGFPPATAAIGILDDETPPAPYDPTPADREKNVALTLVLTWYSGMGEALVNGNFESGDFTGWTVENGGFGNWSISNGQLDPEGPEESAPPLEGKFDALTTQIGASRRVLFQDVLIPAAAQSATLSWSDRIRNYAAYFAEPNQQFRVTISDTAGNIVARPFATKPGDLLTNDWTQRSFNLSPFRGQKLRVAFEQEDNLGYFNTRLDNVSVRLGAKGEPTVFDVYLGTRPTPGPAEFRGTTTNAAWTPPPLALDETYYWQIVARRGTARAAGPVWRFSTRGVGALHHFEWGLLASPQQVGQPIPVTVTAKDDANNTVKSFDGAVSVTGLPGAASASSIVISEIDTGANDAAEFINISTAPVDLSGWQITVYDSVSWPSPHATVTIPTGTICPQRGVFRLNTAGTEPGRFPIFFVTTNVNWANTAVGNPIAVLLRDAAGNIVDCVCAGDARASQITEPMPIPRSEWMGEPAPVTANGLTNTLQRIGASDQNTRSDWASAPASLGAINTLMSVPFTNRVIAAAPVVLTNFSAGVWTGQLTLNEAAPRVTLRADDGRGHVGFANEFGIGVAGDAGVAVPDFPDLILLGDIVSYHVIVTNTGPARATGLLVTNWLPEGMSFVGATTFDGACSHVGNVVICDFGVLSGGHGAEAVISARAHSTGTFTNELRIVRSETDPYPANNDALSKTAISGPSIWAANITVNERTGADATAIFNVRLSAPCTLPVSVRYATSDLSATAGVDYTPVSGTLVFAPGITNLPVPISILGDAVDESLEVILLNLFDPTNGVVATPQARCRIFDDDPTPNLSIIGDTVTEGPIGGTNAAVFEVRLSAVSSVNILVTYATFSGTAIEGIDFDSVFGTLVFPPGTARRTISVPIRGDRIFEPTKTFYVGLLASSNAIVVGGKAEGVILDDDADALDRFVWSEVPSPQYAGLPFIATLTALDGLGRRATNFNGPVSMQAVANSREVIAGAGTNSWDQPLGAFFHDDRTQVIYWPEEIGGAGRINALSLRVNATPGQTLSNWTIRLQHTSLRSYGESPAWESNGWTTVYRQDETLVSTGWVTFLFSAPFAYNGTSSLLVDFSFDDPTYTFNGQCMATMTVERRSLYFQTDSAFGDPLKWSPGSAPPPVAVNRIPNIRFTLEEPVRATPAGAVQLVQGVWSGTVSVLEEATNVVLRASDGNGRIAVSQVFDVDSPHDADGDGMPDAWESRYFGSNHAPDGGAGDDPDGDGMTSLEEFRAGTNPLDAASTARIADVRLVSGDVHLYFTSVPGKGYRVEASDRIDSRTWTIVTDNLPGTGDILEAVHSKGAGGGSRFYRVRVIP